MTIYRFVNKDNKTIYVGKTTKTLKMRLNAHCITDGTCPTECYEEVDRIFYFNVKSEIDLCLYEIYFINIFKPKYNTQDKYLKSDTTIVLPKVEWNEVKYKFKQEKIERLKKNKTRRKKVNNFLKENIKNNQLHCNVIK